MKWLVIESRLLDNEQILFVFEKKHLKEARRAYPSMAIYFPPEIKELHRHKDTPDYPQVLKHVHLVKKEFGGWIIPSTSSLAWKVLQAQRRSKNNPISSGNDALNPGVSMAKRRQGVT